jgi:hypothetical protein
MEPMMTLSPMKTPLTREAAKAFARDLQTAANLAGSKLSYTQALVVVARNAGYANVHEMTAQYGAHRPAADAGRSAAETTDTGGFKTLTPLALPTVLTNLVRLAQMSATAPIVHLIAPAGSGVRTLSQETLGQDAIISFDGGFISDDDLQGMPYLGADGTPAVAKPYNQTLADEIAAGAAVLWIDLYGYASTRVRSSIFESLGKRRFLGVDLPLALLIIVRGLSAEDFAEADVDLAANRYKFTTDDTLSIDGTDCIVTANAGRNPPRPYFQTLTRRSLPIVLDGLVLTGGIVYLIAPLGSSVYASSKQSIVSYDASVIHDLDVSQLSHVRDGQDILWIEQISGATSRAQADLLNRLIHTWSTGFPRRMAIVIRGTDATDFDAIIAAHPVGDSIPKPHFIEFTDDPAFEVEEAAAFLGTDVLAFLREDPSRLNIMDVTLGAMTHLAKIIETIGLDQASKIASGIIGETAGANFRRWADRNAHDTTSPSDARTR